MENEGAGRDASGGALSFPVAPVQGGPPRRRPVAVAIVAGVSLAVGLAIGLSAGAQTPSASATATPSPTPGATSPASPTGSTGPGGPSTFAAFFSPADIVRGVPGGDACTVAGSGVPPDWPTSPYTLVRAWNLDCAVAVASQAAYVQGVEGAVESAVRAAATGVDAGLADGPPSVELLSYASGGSTGSVTVVATAHGGTVSIVIVLAESDR